MKSNVLVTGGAGYIGSHACLELAKAGYQPVVIDDLSKGYKHNVQWGPLEVADIRDSHRLNEIFLKYRPVAVMHFAGLTDVGESCKFPLKYYDVNVSGTITLLTAMQKFGCNTLIFSSTCAVYGITDNATLNENNPLAPISPYAQSKAMAEKMIRDQHATAGLNSTIIRYFNASGADPQGRLAEEHNPETHLIPILFEVISGQRKKFVINGDRYPTTDGTCIRDYIHVSDLASLHVMALDRLLQDKKCVTINAGVGHGYSVKQVLKLVEDVTGTKISYEVGPPRNGDAPSLVADSSLARSLYNWSPVYTDLKDHIQHVWSWISKRSRKVS